MAELANVWVTILPDTSKIAPKIKEAFRDVEKAAAEAGKKSGKDIADGVAKAGAGDKLSQDIKGGLDKAGKAAADAGDKAGKGFSSHFTKWFKKPAEKAGSEAGSNAGKMFADGFQRHSAKIGLAAGAVTGAIGMIGKSSMDYAAEAEQSYGAVESIFGKHADVITKASKTAADAVGLSGREYRELSSTMGAMLGNIGTPVDEVAEKSQNLVKIGADLSATFGGDTSQAVGAISALLRGETDPIERYGISIKQADIKARMAADGLKGLKGEAEKQAQAQTVLKMLTEQSSKAQGQFARETDTAAHKQQVANAKIGDAKEKIGTLLLPVMSKFADVLAKVADAAAKHPKLFTAIGLAIGGAALAITAAVAVAPILTAWSVAASAAGVSMGGLALSMAAAAAPFIAIGAVVVAAGAALWAFFTKTETGRKIWKKFTDAVKKGVEWIKNAVKGLFELTTKGNVSEALTKAFGVNKDSKLVKNFLAVRTQIVSVLKGIVKVAKDFGKGVKQFFDFWVKPLAKVIGWLAKTLFDALKPVVKFIAGVVYDRLVPVFKFLGSQIKNVWNNIIKPVWDFMKSAVGLLADVLTGNFGNIGNRFKEMGKALWGVAKGVVKAAFDFFKNTVKLAIDSSIGWIGNFPNRVKTLFADAKTWLVNAGKDIIRGLIHGISSSAHLIGDAVRAVVPDSMERFVPGLQFGGEVPAFARGGVLPDIPGVSRSQRDPILGWSADKKRPVARVEPGEFIVNREATARHLPLLAAINGGRLNPSKGDLGLPGYADGGVVGFGDVMRLLKGGYGAPGSLERAPYTWAGGLMANWGDCSGLQSAIASLVTGVPLAGRKFATASQAAWLSAHNFLKGLGPRKNAYAVGFINGGPGGGHTAGTIYDGNGNAVNVEMGGARGDGQIGGQAAGAADFPNVYWHPLSGMSGASGAQGEPVSTSLDGVKMSSGEEIDWGTAGNLASEVESSRHRNKQLKRWVAGIYDTGGILPTGGIAINKGAPERVLPPGLTIAFDKFVSLVPGLASSLEKFSAVDWDKVSDNFAASAAKDMADGGNIRAFLSNMSASDGLEIGDRVGGLFGGGGKLKSLFGGVTSGYEQMQDAAVAQVDASDAVVQAEKRLIKVRQEFAQQQADDVQLSDKMKRRMEDATRAVEKAKAAPVAKSDAGGSKKAAKIADAERKLARVREDAAKELEKNGSKSVEKTLDAQKAVTDAENDLSTARGVVKAAAQATGHAEVSMALDVLETAVEVGKFISGLVQDVFKAQAMAAQAVAEHFAALAEQAKMVADLRATIVGLGIDFVKAQIDMAAAARQRRLTEVSGQVAVAEAIATVADRQAAFDAQRKADAKSQLALYDDLSAGLDRFRWNMAGGFNQAMGDLAAWSDESHALYSELLAAQTGIQIAQQTAAKNNLDAVYAQVEASFKLSDAVQGLNFAAKQLQIMAKNNFGMDQAGATAGERYAKLTQELAEIEAKKADASTWLNPVNWFNGYYKNADRRQSQIREELAELEKSKEFQKSGFDKSLVDDVVSSAGWSGFFGAGDQIGDLIKNSALGDATRALQRAEYEKKQLEIRKQREDLRTQVSKGRAEVDYLSKLQPLQALIDSLNLERQSHESAAKGWREKNENVRQAYMRVSATQAEGAQKIVQVPADKTAFSFDEVQDIITELGGGLEQIQGRVRRLEVPPVTGGTLTKTRRG